MCIFHSRCNEWELKNKNKILHWRASKSNVCNMPFNMKKRTTHICVVSERRKHAHSRASIKPIRIHFDVCMTERDCAEMKQQKLLHRKRFYYLFSFHESIYVWSLHMHIGVVKSPSDCIGCWNTKRFMWMWVVKRFAFYKIFEFRCTLRSIESERMRKKREFNEWETKVENT